MAKITPGPLPGIWKAYYWDRAEKKQVWVPAEVCRLWDGRSKEEAQAALDAWTEANGVARIRSRRRSALAGDEVTALIDAFLAEHATLRAPKAATLAADRAWLQTYALAYFVQHHALKDVRQWYRHTAGYTMWLRTTHARLKVRTVKKICQALRRFGEYLARHNVIAQPWLIALPADKVRPTTPLVREVLPAEALAVAAKLAPEHPTWAIAVLLGYFASLRPEEIYCLTKADFLTGDRAKAGANTHARLTKLKLGTSLSVIVSKAKTREADVDLPKTHFSFGVVNVWWPEAENALRRLLRDLPAGPLFPGVRQAVDTEWTRIVYPVLQLHAQDLRRASGLYLGRTAGLDPFLLQDHLRHSSIDTTLLYTRRPATEGEEPDQQDFDDVAEVS